MKFKNHFGLDNAIFFNFERYCNNLKYTLGLRA